MQCGGKWSGFVRILESARRVVEEAPWDQWKSGARKALPPLEADCEFASRNQPQELDSAGTNRRWLSRTSLPFLRSSSYSPSPPSAVRAPYAASRSIRSPHHPRALVARL